MFKVQTLSKIFWIVIAPQLFGFLSWLIDWKLKLSFDYKFLIFFILAVGLSLFFYKKFENVRKIYQLYFFEYKLHLPSWFFIFLISSLGIIISLIFGLNSYSALSSIFLGTLLGPWLEEIICRSAFIKYKMGTIEFLFYNTLGSLSFTFMHLWYYPDRGIIENLFYGHFEFAFMLGLLAYKSKFIELPIIIHMLSNFLRYTLPIAILGIGSGYNHLYGLINVILFTIYFLALSGCFGSLKEIKTN